MSLYFSQDRYILLPTTIALGQRKYSRLCREKNLPEACVSLSALLGLWEAAVELALDVDLALAKTVANQPDQTEMQRQLWLTIGQYYSHPSSTLSLKLC